MFFHSEGNSSESVSTTICSLVPPGINRMPSLSASASASTIEPTEMIHLADVAGNCHHVLTLPICHAAQPRSLPCMSHAGNLNATLVGGRELKKGLLQCPFHRCSRVDWCLAMRVIISAKPQVLSHKDHMPRSILLAIGIL